MRQYPYELWKQTLSQESVQTEDGELVAQGPDWNRVSVCRDEPNGGGRSITLDDSSEYVFDSLIQLPKSCPIIARGTLIRVMQGEVLRVSGTVRRFQADQLHSRLWV